ncbi:Centromere/kinetochore Zw10-domain-containing protein, partial [Phascolomyces articulosus]
EKCVQLKNTLITTLQDKLTSAIVYNGNGDQGLTTIHVYSTTDAKNVSHLVNIFDCFDLLDMLSAELANVKRTLMKNIVAPLFDHCRGAIVSVESNNTLCLRYQQQEHNGKDQGYNTDEKSYPDIACQFISEQFFNGGREKNKTRLFGNLILPEIFQQLIQQAISPAIPQSASQLASFDIVAQAVQTLEHNCIYNSVILYVNNMDKHFAAKRRDKLLLDGRCVMLRRLYDVEDIMDMDPRTHTLQQYQITQTPKLLSLLLIDTIKEANSLLQQLSSPHAASGYKLFNVVHDLLDLFRAIMPQFHRAQFLSSPQSALVFRNDCYWLANTLSTELMPEVKKANKAELIDNLQGAVDNVRTLGESWFELAMAQWVRVLQNALNQTGKFVGIAENRQRQQDLIDQIRSYAVTLRPVVSECVYFDLVSRVVDSDIEDLQDIGADDSHLIAQSLNSLIQLVDVFDTKDQPATEPIVMHRVPSWRKFWFLKDMLDMNLRDIMDHYRRGELFMFEKKELISLICALFADTDLRASMVREIQSTDPPPPPVFSPTSSGLSPSIEQQHQQQQQPQERLITPKLNTLAMVQPEGDAEDEVTGEGWGWDDDPVISSPNHHEEGENQGIKHISSNRISHLSMRLDDHDQQEEGDGWGLNDDDDDVLILPPQDKGNDPALSKKSSPLSMQLDDHDKHATEGWGLDDDEPLEEKPNAPPSMKDVGNADKVTQGQSGIVNMDKQEEPKKKDIPLRSDTTSSSMLSMMDEPENEEDSGWGDADEDVHLSSVH